MENHENFVTPFVRDLISSNDLSWASLWQAPVKKGDNTIELEDLSVWESRWKSQMKTELNRRSILLQMRDEISSTVNAYAVVLVLLASVTFMVYFQPPGGFTDDGTLNMIAHFDTIFAYDIDSFFIYASASFHLAVTGILVCMSCIAFVIPSAGAYPEGMSMGEVDASDYAESLSVTDKKQLHSRLQAINNRVSLALKVARVLATVANIFFVTSVWSSVYVVEASFFIVMPLHQFPESVASYVTAFSFIFSVMFCIYSLALLWNIFNPATDALTDTIIAIICFTCRVMKSIYTFSKKAYDALKNMDTYMIMITICTKSLSLAISVAKHLVLRVKWTLKQPRLCVRWSIIITLIFIIIAYREYSLHYIIFYVFFAIGGD